MNDSPLTLLFDTSDYPARWDCGNWSSLAGWTHILADLAIFGAYAAIPLSIAYFVWKRKEVQLPTLWWLFAAFIFSCGFTHLVEASLFWHPWYRFSALLKVITAVVSWATVFAIYRSLPGLTKLPGLAQLNTRLLRSEENLAITLNSIGDAVLATDATGRITRMNPIAELLTGWVQSESKGRPIEEIFHIVHEHTREPAVIPVKEVLETESTVELASDTVLIAKSGTEHAISDSAAPIRDSKGKILGVIMVFRDVTEERQRAEAERDRMERSIRFQSLLLEMRGREGDDQVDFLRFVTQRVAEALSVERVSIWFLNEKHAEIKCENLFLRSSDTHEQGLHLSALDYPEYFQAISGNEPIAADDAETHPATRAFAGSYLKRHGITSMLDVPIREAASLVGVVCCEHVGDPRKWTLEEIDFLSTVVGTIEVFRENAKWRAAEAEVRRLNQNLELLVEERTNELGEQKEFMSRLLENLSDGVIACDAEGRLSFFNRVAREWHGGDFLTIPREQWSEFFSLFDGDGKSQLSTDSIPLVRALAGESVRNASVSILARGQKPRILIVNGDPLYKDTGEKVGAVVAMHDVTEQKRAEEALRLSGERAQLAAEAGKVGIWDLDVGTGALDWSDQMYAMYGFSRETPADHNLWFRSVHPEDREQVMADLKLARDDPEQPFNTEFRIIHKNTGETRDIRAVATVFRDENGEPHRILGANWDVTGERKREHALTQALDNQRELTQAAKAGERAKSEFLAVMSHEIRTPMNGILGFAALLKQSSSLNEEDRSSVETISRSAESLLRILDDILDFSYIEAGGLVMVEEDFSPRQLVNDLQNFFLPSATAKGLDLQVNVAPDIPSAARSDSGRIRQILINLLNNAMKFTAEGSVTMTIRYVRNGPGKGELEAIVQDSGPGISPDELERIFEPFQQTDSSLARSYGGTGLGLAISRRLATLLGGTLRIDSSPNKGSRFTLLIPASEGKVAPLAPFPPDRQKLPSDFARQYPLRILIVEDDRVNLRLVVNVIGKLGYKPLTARDGSEAIACFKEQSLDFILMDVQMPKMNGIQATKRIRALEANGTDHPVFICALTANVVPKDRQKCIDAGMNDFMCKPLRIPSLIASLKMTYELKKG